MANLLRYAAGFLLCMMLASQGCGLLPKKSNTYTQVARSTSDSVVIVQTLRKDGKKTFGSGAIIDAAEGLILTNYHVVAQHKVTTVYLEDGREYEAKVLGTDIYLDVALVKIEAPYLKQMRLAQPNSVQVGDMVVAIGNGFALGQSYTLGMVSALRRGPRNFIQSDATTNPGNSGGPLVNTDGELIGLSTEIVTMNGQSAGVSWALPVESLTYAIKEIRHHGRVRRGTFGCTDVSRPSVTFSKEGAEFRQAGIMINDFLPKSVCSEWNKGDVILAVNGNPVRNVDTLDTIEAVLPVDTPLYVTYLRAGKVVSRTVKLKPIKV